MFLNIPKIINKIIVNNIYIHIKLKYISTKIKNSLN